MRAKHEHAQAAIGLVALLGGAQCLASRTVEHAVGLEREVLSREASCFPGQGDRGGSIALHRCLLRSWLWTVRHGRSKRGGAQRLRLELMQKYRVGGSRSTARPPASTPVPRRSESTSGPGPARCLHLPMQARNAPRCRYSSTTSQAVNARLAADW